MSGAFANQPRVRRNEWGALDVAPLGSGTPLPSVSVVVPAWNAGRLLPLVLAGLSAQTHPAHLLEVLVVNDGPEPLELPEVRPENTRILDVDPAVGWGRAHACHVGALAADGDVLHWYDADLLAERHEVEAHARWHTLIDHAVVLGTNTFVDPTPVLALEPSAVREAVAADRLGELFPEQGRQAHTWVEEMYARTDRLRQAGWFAVRAHIGMSGSVRRELYLDAGGMPTRLRLGEDTALGVRLGEAGAVFVPDPEARSWHLGLSNVMRRAELVNTYNGPYLAEDFPVLRGKRFPGRTYRTPYLEVVLDTGAPGGPGDTGDTGPTTVLDAVDALLDGTLHDVEVILLGPWSSLDDDRVSVLDDESFGVRLVHDSYVHEPRVRLLESLPEGRSAAPFRLTLPHAGFVPGRRGLEKLVLHVEHTHDGRRDVALPDGSLARLERTAAYARARRLALPGESLDDVVDQVAGSGTVPGGKVGFRPSAESRPQVYPRTGGPPVGPEEAWARIEKAQTSRRK